MRIEFDYDYVDLLRSEIEGTLEYLENYINAFEKTIEELKNSSESVAFLKAQIKWNEAFTKLTPIWTALSDIQKEMNEYFNNLEDINPSQRERGVYLIDTSTVYNAAKIAIEKYEELSEYVKDFDYYPSQFIENVREYNYVDSNLNLESEYQDDPETLEFIVNKRKEVNEKIKNYNYNMENIVKPLRAELRRTFELDAAVCKIDPLQKIKSIMQDIEEHENKYDQGFWHDNGGAISDWVHGGLDGISVVATACDASLVLAPAAETVSDVADLLNAAIYGIEGLVTGDGSKYVDMGISLAAAVPITGTGVIVGKCAFKAGEKVGKFSKVGEKAIKFFKGTEKEGKIIEKKLKIFKKGNVEKKIRKSFKDMSNKEIIESMKDVDKELHKVLERVEAGREMKDGKPGWSTASTLSEI